ncbi:MAG: starch-binding protein [Prevotella sp.]|nr:starch-binding protein [Prevotella sp.]
MRKTLFKLFSVMAFCMLGLANVNAKVEQVHATFENPSNTNTTWNAETRTFTWSTTYYNQLRNIGLPSGDLTKYKKLVVDCTIKSGDRFRILFYKGGSNLTLYASNGVNEFILADTLAKVAPNDYNEYLLACDEICLSGNNGAAPGEAVINDVYLETYNDEGEKVFATFENPSNTNTTWNAETKTFTWSTTYYNQLRNIGLPSGDISKYKKLVVDCTIKSGDKFRILFYKGGSNLTLYASNGVNEFILADTLAKVSPKDYNEYLLACDEICLSGNNAAAPGEAVINEVYLETYPENEQVYIPEIQYEEDPGKPAGDFVDFTEAFPSLQPRIGIGADEHPIVLGNGDVVVGARSKNVIADLSAYSKLTFVTSPKMKLVLYMNHEVDAQQNAGDYAEGDAGKYVFMDLQADENGLIEVDLTQFDKADLNCICLPWDNSNKGTVWYILLTKKEEAGNVLANIAALKNFSTEEMGAVSAVLKLTNAKVNFITTKQATDYDDDWNEITVTKDYVLLEDASAGYVLEGSGLGSYVKVGDVLNGKLAISLIDNFGWGIYQTTLTNGIEGVTITKDKVQPIVVTDDNITEYLADNDFRLAQFGDAVINIVEGENGDELAFKSAPLGDEPVSIMDTYSVIPETIADGTKAILTGYMASLYGSSFFVPTAIIEKPFKATFTSDRKWDKVYAYAWSGEGENVVEFLGPKPGTELTATEGVYEVSIDANAIPEYIIFSDGGSDQTQDLPFEAGKAYQYNLTITEGSYYVMNMAKVNEMLGSSDVEELMNSGKLYNQLYMAAGHNWGTKGIVNDKGLDFTLTYNPSNKTYNFDSRVSNGGNNHFMSNGLWMDGPAYGWTIEGDVPDCTISGMFDGVKKYIAVDANQELYLTENADEPTAKWTFIHKSNYDYMVNYYGLEAMKAATVDAPADATFLIKTPDFNRNDLRNDENWTIEAGNKNLKGGGDNGYGCAESYHSTFTLSQVLADAPAGVYALTAQGFYRQDDNKTEDAPVFYANEETATFPVKTGNENDMNAAGASFAAGSYAIEPIFVQVTEKGQLTIGAKGTATSQWVIWDNFQLKYYGANATIDQVKAAALLVKVDELLAQLDKLLKSEEIEVESVVTRLTGVYEQYTENRPTNVETAQVAIAFLTAAVEIGEGYIKAKNVLPQMKKLTESTNFYTEEALEKYYGQWQKKYEEGELAPDEANALQDPFVVTGWRASNNADDLLMSAWDVAPENWGQYYINTWSVEGATDGTDFAVPFFEYWTGDDNSLGEKVLTGTVTGLEPGTYGVSAWVRVRGKNNFTRPAYGITMQVNNGTAIDAAASTEVPNSNFYVGQMSAIGEVAEDGVLTLKFNVAADNNISWLSFKNVKYNKMQTFSAKFENEDTWEKVYAYTSTGGEYDKVEQLGAWPGTELTADESGIYNVTIVAQEAPANIIFSNGLEGEGHIQTEDFVFEDGKTYKYLIPATDIAINPEDGADIAVALTTAEANVRKVGNISITLAQGGSYTVSEPLTAPANFKIEGNNAVIDASGLNGNFIQTATTTASPVVDYVSIKDANVKGLKKPLFYSTQKGYLIDWLTIDNCIIEVAADVTSIDFTKGSAARNVSIENSTIYAPVSTTKSFYSSQAGQKLTELDEEGTQTFIIKNSTMYNLAKGKNFFTHRQSNQKWLAYTVENSLFVNCGKSGQVIKGMNGGQSGSNPTWTITGNAFNFETDGVMADTSAAEDTGDTTEGEGVQNSVAGIITFTDAAAGDFNGKFTLSEGASKPETLGDPRWTIFDPTDPTGINSIFAKAVENGEVYNLQGQKVQKLNKKGLYIINGKKVVKK